MGGKRVIIMSGSSGTGKSTVINKLMEDCPNQFSFSISHTTRKPREGEKDGVDYFYISQEKFDEMIKNDEFIEFEKNYDNSYGTSKAEI